MFRANFNSRSDFCLFNNSKFFSNLEQFCEDLESEGFGFSEAGFRSALASVNVEFVDIDALIACLETVGIEFVP